MKTFTFKANVFSLNSRSLLFALIALFLSGSGLNAQSYTTISNGDLNNPAIWSTDGGISGCNCTPTTELAAFSVMNMGTNVDINHNVSLNKDVIILSNFLYVNVNFGGSLSGENRNLDARNGVLNNFGAISVGSMIVYNGAEVNSTGSVTVSPGDLTIANTGRMNVAGTLTITDGDFYNDGLVDILANAQVIVGGALTNEAVFDLEPGACVNVTGNVTNNYQVNLINGPGTAYIQSAGDVNNAVTWATEVDWCAGGTGSGLVHAANCSNCGTLPVELIGFEAELNDGQVTLSWETASEISNSHFTIERSNDGTSFESLIRVDSESPVGGKVYQVFDVEPYQGISYYRLSQTDQDGSTTRLETVLINNDDAAQASFKAFPNPFTEQIRVTANGLQGNAVTVKLTDLSGRVVTSQQIDHTMDFEVYELNPGVLEPGLYVVTVSSNLKTESFKLLHQ